MIFSSMPHKISLNNTEYIDILINYILPNKEVGIDRYIFTSTFS